MVDAQRLHWQRKHDASQVVRLRDRTSADPVDTVCSCELTQGCRSAYLGDQRTKATVSRVPSRHRV